MNSKRLCSFASAFLLLSLQLLFLPSCVSTKRVQFYDGPPRPRAEIARLAIPPNGLTSLDGKQVKEFFSFPGTLFTDVSETIDLLPGRHALRVDWLQTTVHADFGPQFTAEGTPASTRQYAISQDVHSKLMTLDAQPGASYWLKWEQAQPGEASDPGTRNCYLSGYVLQLGNQPVPQGVRRTFIDASPIQPQAPVARFRLVLKDVTADRRL